MLASNPIEEYPAGTHRDDERSVILLARSVESGRARPTGGGRLGWALGAFSPHRIERFRDALQTHTEGPCFHRPVGCVKRIQSLDCSPKGRRYS